MIETQVVKEKGKPKAVILDYKEYRRLKGIEEDMSDYLSAVKTKRETKTWISHNEIKKELNMNHGSAE